MKKLAIFVEGQTEQIFIEKIIRIIAQNKSIAVEKVKLTGGSRDNPRVRTIVANDTILNKDYFIYIYDSSTDNRVASDIKDNYASLQAENFSHIIGIRDVYPSFEYTDIAKLRCGLKSTLITGALPIDYILGVMEIESWFLAEYNHFLKIDPRLTLLRITDVLGYNPAAYDVQQIPTPAKELNSVYQTVSKSYSKSKKHVNRTVDAIDYSYLITSAANRIPDLNNLIIICQKFFTH